MSEMELTLGPMGSASGNRITVDGQEVTRMLAGLAVRYDVRERTEVTLDFLPTNVLAKLIDVDITATFGGLDPRAMIAELESALYGSPVHVYGEDDETRWHRIVDGIATERRRHG